MALKKTDCLLLLTELQERGIEVTAQINKLMSTPELSLDVLKFINDRRQIDVAAFYERLRKNYNDKKSNLYINIVKEIEDPQEVLTTLAAMQLQILLYSKHVNNKKLFLESSRAEEITLVLNNYFKTYDITNALKLLRIYKADLVALEFIAGRR